MYAAYAQSSVGFEWAEASKAAADFRKHGGGEHMRIMNREELQSSGA
jgi:hypothetical protein